MMLICQNDLWWFNIIYTCRTCPWDSSTFSCFFATLFLRRFQHASSKVLFGHCRGQGSDNVWYNKLPVLSQHRLYKDFPEPGDSSYLAYDGMMILRPLPSSHNRFRVVFVFRTPEDKWASWAEAMFPAYTLMFHSNINQFLNGPKTQKARAVDAKMYLVLALRSFNRGHPLVPGHSKDSVTVGAGEALGLVFWKRFAPHGRFHLAEYLQCFMERIGHQLKTYEVMDGRKLVKYQCVVRRQDWEQVKHDFFEAFKVQRAAYRHVNGGTATPSLVEDVHPRFVSHDFSCCHQPEVIKTVVRKTFVELDEGSSSGSDLKRSNSSGEILIRAV